MIVLQKPGSKLDWSWNIRLNGFKSTLSDQIKFLGIYLDKHLNDHYQLPKLIMQKLARALDMLSKVRQYDKKCDKNIYHAIFELSNLVPL